MKLLIVVGLMGADALAGRTLPVLAILAVVAAVALVRLHSRP